MAQDNKPIEVAGEFSQVGLFNPEGQPQFRFKRDRSGIATFLDELAGAEAASGGSPMTSRLMNNPAFRGQTPEEMEQMVRANEAQRANMALQGSGALTRSTDAASQIQAGELARRLQAIQGKGSIESNLANILATLQRAQGKGQGQPSISDLVKAGEFGAISPAELRQALGLPPQ